MSGRKSAQHDQARNLVLSGATVKDACRRTGISPSAIYRTEWYRAHVESEEYVDGRRRPRLVSKATLDARHAITEGQSVLRACRDAGIDPSTIYNSKWWAIFKGQK